ncbi:MAG: response regulator [Waterburya sp.]
MIRILLVDDQNIVRQGLQALLEPRVEFQVVGTASDGKSAIEQVETLKPDVVLIDIEMPGMSGITATHKICQKFPKTKVLILSSHENQKYVAQALQAGAEGYLLKHTLAEDLEQAIWSVYQGHFQIESRLLKGLLVGASVSKSITSVEPNGSISISQQLLQKRALNELYTDVADISEINFEESIINKKNGSSSKINKTQLELAFEQSKAEIQDPPDNKTKTSNINNSSTKQAIKELSVQQKFTERQQKTQPESLESKSKSKSPNLWRKRSPALIIGLTLMIGGITVYALRQFSVSQPKAAPETVIPKITTVTALGSLEPSGEIITISAPSSTEGSRVEKLLVKEGDTIAPGQMIAILDSRDSLEASLSQAQEEVRVAQANLTQIKAGAKTGEIEAQKAAIARIETERNNEIAAQTATVSRMNAELNNAKSEYQRYQTLYNDGAISTSERDGKQLAVETTQEQLAEAKANLNRISSSQQQQLVEAKATLNKIAEVRPVDIDVAIAKVRQATTAVKTAQAKLARAYVKAPQAGKVIKVLTLPGEVVSSSEGIARIGQTNQMYVNAEVYESDIGKVQVGQQATVTSSTFSGQLNGTVEQIGLEVQRQDVVNTDPTANIDAKVIEVKVKLDQESSQKVAGLTNLLVNVRIAL